MIKNHLDKVKVKSAFSKAADTYEKWAQIQKTVEDQLLKKLFPKKKYNKILEVGCGVGRFTEKLALTYPDSQILAIDIAPGMVVKAKNRLSDYSRVTVQEADGEELPIQITSQGPFDLIISSSTFQWFDNLSKTLVRYSQILSYNGQLLFSIFGHLTLNELNLAINLANPNKLGLVSTTFLSKNELTSILKPSFSSSDIEEVILKKEYDSLIELLKSLKYTGVAPPIYRPLIKSRKGMEKIEKEFLNKFSAIKATYQIFFVNVKNKK